MVTEVHMCCIMTEITASHYRRRVPKAELSAPQPVEMRKRETDQSQFNVPDSDSTKQTEHQNETEDPAGQLGGEEEEKEKMENPQQMQNNTALPKRRQGNAGQKISKIELGTMNRQRKRDLILLKMERAQLEESLRMKRSGIARMDKLIAAKTRRVKALERLVEEETHNFEESLKRIERKSVEAETLFEEQTKTKQEKNSSIEKIHDDIGTIESEIEKIEENLNESKRNKNVQFMLQEALKVEVLSDAADEQNTEPQSSVGQGLECEEDSSPDKAPSSTGEPRLSSAHSPTLVTNSKLDNDNSGHEEELELYFSDPQQLLDLMMEQTEQLLSLIRNSARGNEPVKELQQTTTITRKKMKEDEEKLAVMINDVKHRIDIEKERAAKLKLKVQLHDSLENEDEDALINALGVKVTKVHRCTVDSRLTNSNTFEKLYSIECHMTSLLQQIESIPEESLEMQRQLKDSERRSRLYEEKLRLEAEKRRERMEKRMLNTLTDSKKKRGRKLMPRCIHVEQKIKVSEEDHSSDEDELHAYLFTTEDTE